MSLGFPFLFFLPFLLTRCDGALARPETMPDAFLGLVRESMRHRRFSKVVFFLSFFLSFFFASLFCSIFWSRRCQREMANMLRRPEDEFSGGFFLVGFGNHFFKIGVTLLESSALLREALEGHE